MTLETLGKNQGILPLKEDLEHTPSILQGGVERSKREQGPTFFAFLSLLEGQQEMQLLLAF